MAFAVRDRRVQDDYANYEQQSPNRDVYYRQANTQQQNYMGGYNNYQYNQGYAQPQDYDYQQGQQATGYFQTQASQFVSNGFNAPQYNYNYMNSQEQFQQDMQFNQNYDRGARAKKISRERVGKRNINKDMIKIIVTIMVVAIAICGLLIANQFISVNNQAQAEENVQNIDSELLATIVTEDGSYVVNDVTVTSVYEYEESTNWFDRFCDRLSGKLK